MSTMIINASKGDVEMFDHCTGCKRDKDDLDNDICCNCFDGAEFEPKDEALEFAEKQELKYLFD